MYKNIRSICYCSLCITQEYVSTYREDLHGSLDSENYEKDENNENLLLGAFVGIPKNIENDESNENYLWGVAMNGIGSLRLH